MPYGMNMIEINTGAAAGSAGSATANADTTSIVSGCIYAVYVKYNDSPPAGTTDITIKTKGTAPAPPSNTILTITDAATDGWFYPRHQIDDEAGAGVTYDGTNQVYEPVPVHDLINVAIAGANAADNADIWILYR